MHRPAVIIYKRSTRDNRCVCYCATECDGLECAFYTRDEAIAYIANYLGYSSEHNQPKHA